MTDAHTKDATWKQRARRELRKYWATALYLAVFFTAFTAYERLILDANELGYLAHGTSLLEALILAKIIVIGDAIHLGHKMEEHSLVYPTLYKTLLFAALLAFFELLEHTAVSLLHGKGFEAGLSELASQNRYALLAKCVILFTAFIPFFAFKELGRVLGEGHIASLFFRRNGLQAPTPAPDVQR